MGHGDGAEMAALCLGGEIEPHGAAGHRAGGFAAVVRRAVDTPADTLGHQRMIGGVELHEVDAVALAVHDPELGRVLVGDTAEIERLGRAVILAARRQRSQVEPIACRRVAEWLIGAEKVDIAQGGRLVERGVFEEAGGHAHSLDRMVRRASAIATTAEPVVPDVELRLKNASLLRSAAQSLPSYLKESFSLVR